jgi:hypothetical protein
MKIRTASCRLTLLAALLLVPCLGSSLHAQTPEDAPAVALGNGGRMVRGTVSAVTTDHLTIKTEQGDSFQVAVTPNTQVRKGRDPMKFAEVKVGDGVGAMGEIDRPNKTVHAMMLMVVTAEQIKKAKEDMGKTYIAGKITAMDELKLTILRSDNVTQVIQVDESTSFKKGGRAMQMAMGGGEMGMGGGMGRGPRAESGAQPASRPDGGESITLADIKVGDMVGGPGALKSGVFIPSELRVADPAARPQRRRQGTGAGAGTDSEPKPTPPPTE